MFAPLDNQVVFKRAFTNKLVFERFVEDLFDVKISVSKIETEKRFYNKVSKIDVTLDIYAETDDHRFVIEIQKIQYDHNFERFLYYFMNLMIEQQESYKNYKFEKTVLGVIVLTRPYRFHNLTGEPILDNYFVIDFNPRNYEGELIKLNNHELKFINTSKKYKKHNQLPRKIQDWIDLFQKSIYENETLTLNFNNKAIKKVTELINNQNIDTETLTKIRQEEGSREVLILEHKAGIEEGIEKGIEKEKKRSKKILEKAEQEKQKAEQERQKAELTSKIITLKFIQKKSDKEIAEILKIKIEYIAEVLKTEDE